MHRLPLLFCLTLPLLAQAEDPVVEPIAATLTSPQPDTVPDNAPSADADVDLEHVTDERIKALESRLAQSEQQREALSTQLAAQSAEPDHSQDDAVIARLTQENQRLELQLREARTNQTPRLLTEQQTWYAAGAGTALVAFILGMLSRGRRRSRREWIN